MYQQHVKLTSLGACEVARLTLNHHKVIKILIELDSDNHKKGQQKQFFNYSTKRLKVQFYTYAESN